LTLFSLPAGSIVEAATESKGNLVQAVTTTVVSKLASEVVKSVQGEPKTKSSSRKSKPRCSEKVFGSGCK